MNANLTSVRRFFLVAFAILSVLSAQAVKNKDWYVSDDMQYGRDKTVAANCTNDLDAAVTGCSSGYTVWVKNGFVCEKGEHYSNYATNRLLIGSGVTVRSEAGYVDESDPKDVKGAYIHGRFAPGTAHNYGKGAIRAAELKSSTSKLIGFVIENCAGSGNNSYPGGGVRGGGIVSNCVIRNCYDGRGGGLVGVYAYRCVVTNNYAGNGSGIYGAKEVADTEIAYNTGGPACGWYDSKDSPGILRRCSIHRNSGGVYAGGTCNAISVYDCGISNNMGRGAYGFSGSTTSSRPVLFNCTIADNEVDGVSEGAGAWRCELHDCDVIGNRLLWNGRGQGGGCYDCRIFGGSVISNVLMGALDETSMGAGVYNCKVRDCVIAGNFLRSGNGGGCSSSVLTDCQICDNVITNGGFYGGGCSSCTLTNCTVSGNRLYSSVTSSSGLGGGISGGSAVDCRIVSNIGGFRGGGVNNSILKNCIVSNNVVRSTYGGAGGGGAYNCEAYNSIFADNHATNGVGGVDSYKNTENENCLVNCTIVNNPDGGFSGLKRVINCIAWGNGTKASSCTACTNSCVEKLSCSAQDGCFSTDPRLDARYAPKSAKCHNKALPFDWMTDPNDVRSKDVYGAARVQGKGCDIGAVEQPDFGLMLLLR